MFEPASRTCVAEYADLERQLADPAVHADQAAARTARPPLRRARPGRRTPTARWRRLGDDLDAARELAARGRRRSPPRPTRSTARSAELAERLRALLVPRDPDDDKDVILEVKAGEGGEESALFAGDLLRMYLRYAERRGWKTEVLDAQRVRPRRLQGRRGRGQGQGQRRARRRRRGPG